METVTDVTSPSPIPPQVTESVDTVEESTNTSEIKTPEDEKKVTFDIPHRRRPARLQLGGDKEQDSLHLEAALDPFVSEEPEMKWRCKIPGCSKLFKSHHYWRLFALFSSPSPKYRPRTFG